MLKIPGFNFPTHRRPLDFLVMLFISTCPLPAWAEIRVSDPVGIHTIGRPIEVVSTVSAIPPGAESQLRSTCLLGRIVSMENGPQADQLNKVVVNFQPTIAQGGTIEFRSVAPVNHALVRLELVSECPLVVFDMAWPLIMNQREQIVKQEPSVKQDTQEAGLFDPAGSSLLQASRKAPKREPRIRQVVAAVAPENPVAALPEVITNTETSPVEAVVAEPVVDDMLKLAALDQSLLNHGLIESEPVSLGLDADSALESLQRDEPGANFSHVEILAMSTASLLVLGAGWLLIRVRQRSGLAVRIPARGQEPEYKRNAVSEFSDYNASDINPTGQPDSQLSRFGSDRFLESLMGGDEPLYGTELELAEAESMYVDPASGRNLALKTCVEMINRADVRSWDLPPAYQSLVSERNRSLEMHRTPEAMILRCHIGLVELTFQEASQGHAVQLETSNELLQLLLGKHVYELETSTVMGVPDVLKSYVKAKLCEIEGAEKRQLLRENLLSLNSQVEHQALCFHTNAWREFLSEEGLLG